MNTAPQHRRQRGFTLVEACSAMGICAVLASQALPSFAKFHQQQKLRTTAETLATDLRYARAEAVRLGHPVHFRVSGKGANACYVMHTGTKGDCDCTGGRAVCQSSSSAVLRAEWLGSGHPVQLSSNAESLEFQHRQGLVTQTGSVEARLADGSGIRQVVAITGRVRSCYVGERLARLPKCA
ncbi:GspH/FimT family pseudopilin [Pelomonas baiyunensis]|uniref:Type II secretion system protein H n=1 Tax=Pelomonas baiyunensis TaxID=3299026 RepID=A0ABW7H460_9BURK